MLNIFSWGYILFVAIAVALYWIAFGPKARPYFLLVASLLIIAYQPVKLVIATAVYLVATWYLAQLVHSAKKQSTRKFFMIFGIVESLALLAYYKYDVFGDVHALSIAGIKGVADSPLVPLGISYFVFRVIHYLVEVYKGKFPHASLWDFLLYTTFFPTVQAGPIERFDAFEPQRIQPRPFDRNDFLYGLWRIAIGLFKKLVLSATLYQLITPYYAAVGPGGNVLLSTGQLWMMSQIYLMYLYMDFSGYSDIAIGTARLFGYRIMENFNWPIFQPNIGRFWTNWHISLTRWLQEYVYFALGGNKKGIARSILYTFITMGLFGLWHGSGKSVVHFVLFGFFHAMLIVLYRVWRKFRKNRFPNLKPTKIGFVLGVIFTYVCISLGWPLFVHGSTEALTIWAKMLGMDINFKMMLLEVIQQFRG